MQETKFPGMQEIKAKLQPYLADIDVQRIQRHTVSYVNALNVRERGLVFLAIVVLIYGCWDVFFNQSYAKERKSLLAQLVEIDKRQKILDQEVERQEVFARARIDPNLNLREQQERLNAELSSLKASKEDLSRSFIQAEKMSRLLQDLVKVSGGLRLVALETLPSSPLLFGDSKQNETDGLQMVYRHDLLIELEGSYFDTLNYLYALEKQPVYWEAIDYQVTGYPEANILLKVYTLSFDKEWLGV